MSTLVPITHGMPQTLPDCISKAGAVSSTTDRSMAPTHSVTTTPPERFMRGAGPIPRIGNPTDEIPDPFSELTVAGSILKQGDRFL